MKFLRLATIYRRIRDPSLLCGACVVSYTELTTAVRTIAGMASQCCQQAAGSTVACVTASYSLLIKPDQALSSPLQLRTATLHG